MSATKESLMVKIKNPCQSPPPTPALNLSNSTPLKSNLDKPIPTDDDIPTLNLNDITTITWQYTPPSKTKRTFLPEENQKKKEEFDAVLKSCNAPIGFTRNNLNPFSDLNK